MRFTATFENMTLPHGGHVPESSDIVTSARNALREKCKAWNIDPKTVTSIEIYNNEREILFNWKK